MRRVSIDVELLLQPVGGRDCGDEIVEPTNEGNGVKEPTACALPMT